MGRLSGLLLLVAICLSALAQKVLTNEDVVKLVKGGLSEAIILQVIEQEPSTFDISVQALIALKQQGVSNTIVKQMLKVTDAR